MLTKPKAPTQKTVQDSRSDPLAGRAMLLLTNAMIDFMSVVRWAPASLLAVGQAKHPDKTPSEAADLFCEEIKAATLGLKAHRKAYEAEYDAEATRIKPQMSTASRRHFAIIEELASLKNASVRGDSDAVAHREKLEAAGLTKAQIDTIVVPFNPVENELKIAALNLEFEQVTAFISTGDESLLPAGFVAKARI